LWLLVAALSLLLATAPRLLLLPTDVLPLSPRLLPPLPCSLLLFLVVVVMVVVVVVLLLG
jgi:hypothetical protein